MKSVKAQVKACKKSSTTTTKKEKNVKQLTNNQTAANLQQTQKLQEEAQLAQKQMLQAFWANQMSSVEHSTIDFKTHTLPIARIKKVMKTDDDVKNLMISAEAPIVFAKACEVFIEELTLRAWMHAEENKRRTIQKLDIALALTKSDMYDFLIDIVPREVNLLNVAASIDKKSNSKTPPPPTPITGTATAAEPKDDYSNEYATYEFPVEDYSTVARTEQYSSAATAHHHHHHHQEQPNHAYESYQHDDTHHTDAFINYDHEEEGGNRVENNDNK